MEFKDKINQSVAAAVAKIMEKTLHPNQQKLDVHEPEKDELTADDFKNLRAKKKVKNEEVEQLDESDIENGYKIRMKHTDKGRIHSPSGEHVADVTREHGEGWRYHSGGKNWDGSETSKHYKTGVEKTKAAAAKKAVQAHMKEEIEQVDEAKKESKEDFDARQKRLVAAGNETAKNPDRLKKLSKIPGYSAAMNLAKKSTNEEVKDEYARKVDKYLKKKHAPDAPVKEEVEVVYEANIEPTSAKSRSHISNLSNPITNTVTHPSSGKEIGIITKQPSGEYYAHHSAAKLSHAESGTFDSKDKAHQFIRNAHAKAIKNNTLSDRWNKQKKLPQFAKEEVEQLDEYTPGPDGKTMIKGRAYGASKPESDYVKGPSDAELKKIEVEKKKKPVTEEHGSAPKKRGMMGLKAYLTSKKSE
jgi:hypothetical protein